MTHGVDPFARAHVASLRLPEYTGWPACVYALYFVPLLLLSAALLRWRPLGSPPRGKDSEGDADKRNNEGNADEAEGDAHGNVSRAPALLKPASLKLASASLALMLFVIVAHPLSAGLPDG